MSPSSVLFGGLFIGFIVYITMKGELPQYGQVLWGTASSQSSTAGSTSGSTTNSASGAAMQSMQPMSPMSSASSASQWASMAGTIANNFGWSE